MAEEKDPRVLEQLLAFDTNTRDYIKDNEGYREKAYNDTKGIKTTGYGFNMESEHIQKHLPRDVLDGNRKLTQPEGEIVFKKVYDQSVKDAEQFVGKEFFEKLPMEKKKALIDMSYNMGLTSLNKFNNMRAALQIGDFETAREELLDSKYAKEVPERAAKNADLMFPQQQAELSEFGQLFKQAREQGKKQFEFKGKKFTTEVK